MVTEEKREREAEIRRPFALTITKEKMAATTVRNEGFFVRNRNAKKTKLELLEMVTDVIIAALRLVSNTASSWNYQEISIINGY